VHVISSLVAVQVSHPPEPVLPAVAQHRNADTIGRRRVQILSMENLSYKESR
jgi:hypothetical protein